MAVELPCQLAHYSHAHDLFLPGRVVHFEPFFGHGEAEGNSPSMWSNNGFFVFNTEMSKETGLKTFEKNTLHKMVRTTNQMKRTFYRYIMVHSQVVVAI